MILCEKPKIEIIYCDCNDYMKNINNKFFDLAIVDPPYGINMAQDIIKVRRMKKPTHKRRIIYNKTYDTKKYIKKDWDNSPPKKEYFQELFRISKNQIIWGGNYFQLPISSGWIFWDKVVPIEVNFSHGELAWTSFSKRLLQFTYAWSGFNKKAGALDRNRIHPTQKPIELYKWVLKNYSKENESIIDTHLGSGSSAIAAFIFNQDFVGLEIDKDYYEIAVNRISRVIKNYQTSLFNIREIK